MCADYPRSLRKKQRRHKYQWLKKLCQIGGYAAIFAFLLSMAVSNTWLLHGEYKLTAELESYTTERRPSVRYFSYSTDALVAPWSLQTLFELTYIPEGYVLTEHHAYRYGLKEQVFDFRNEAGEVIVFSQKTLSGGVGYDTAYYEIEIIPYRDGEAVCAKSENGISVLWSDYGYRFELKVSDGISLEECLQMMSSIRKVREEG